MPRALVVDDSRAMRMILSKTLAESGFEVMQAANGREALEIMDREGPAIGLVLLDWNMPEVTGIEVVEKLRSQKAFNTVRAGDGHYRNRDRANGSRPRGRRR